MEEGFAEALLSLKRANMVLQFYVPLLFLVCSIILIALNILKEKHFKQKALKPSKTFSFMPIPRTTLSDHNGGIYLSCKCLAWYLPGIRPVGNVDSKALDVLNRFRPISSVVLLC